MSEAARGTWAERGNTAIQTLNRWSPEKGQWETSWPVERGVGGFHAPQTKDRQGADAWDARSANRPAEIQFC